MAVSDADTSAAVTAAPGVLPVSVLMERRVVTSGRWSAPQWDALAVVAGEGVTGGGVERTLVSEADGTSQIMFSGIRLELFKDGCESYWYNLLSGRPRLFVVCFADDEAAEGEEQAPARVTASQDEANAHMESDDPVYSVPMPERVREWLERFVVENYRPETKTKRKRRDWAEEAGVVRRPRS